MKAEIKVPPMGESITEATVGNLLKKTGSQVNMDDELIELETDKVNQVLYAPQNGTVTWSVSPEEVVKIGQVIGTIDPAGISTAAPKQNSSPKEEKAQTQPQQSITPIQKNVELKPEMPQKTKGSVRISKEDFVNEATKQSSKISEEPSIKKSEASEIPTSTTATSGPRETRKKMSKIRKLIAQRLVEAQHTTAMLTTFNEIDLSQVIALREKYKEAFLKIHGSRLGFMGFFVKASIEALKAFPDVNSYVEGDEIVHREYYDIGIAVGSDRGLVVPVVRNCDQLSLANIEKTIEEYGKKAREGKLTADDLRGGGFTITNGGVYGSLLSTPILNPPQSGILGMHKIEKRPVVVDDQIVIRPMMYVALSYDHRIIDGKEAVSFLVKIKNVLEDPARFLLEI